MPPQPQIKQETKQAKKKKQTKKKTKTKITKLNSFFDKSSYINVYLKNLEVWRPPLDSLSAQKTKKQKTTTQSVLQPNIQYGGW